jgi:hypothetical protein
MSVASQVEFQPYQREGTVHHRVCFSVWLLRAWAIKFTPQVLAQIFGHVLRNMTYEPDRDIQQAYLDHLAIFLELLQVGIVAHFRSLMPMLCDYIVSPHGRLVVALVDTCVCLSTGLTKQCAYFS